MLACKLTLVYAQYHQMSDLQSLVASDYKESYEHAEIMASFLNQLLPSRPTSPSELMHSKEEYADEAIDRYKEYKHYLKLYLRTMHKITDLYISLLQEYLRRKEQQIV